MLLDNKPLDMH